MLPFENALPFEEALPFETEQTGLNKKQDDDLYAKYLAEHNAKYSQPQIPTETDPTGTNIKPALTREQWESRNKSGMLDDIAGIVEGPLSIALKLPASMAGVPASIYAAMRGKRGKELEDIVAKITAGPEWTDPKTDRGQKIAQDITTFLQPLGLSPYANVGHLGARGTAFGRPKILDKPIGDLLTKKEQTKPAATIPETIIKETPGEALPFETGDLRLESPIAADIRVAQQNKRLPTADDYNNRDANVRAVEEEIAANEARVAYEAEQARLEAEAIETQKNIEFQKAKQMEIDDHPYGDPPPQYGYTPEFGRIDENGIPIRADLSMEAANLENPLQRNLWGDELPGRNSQDNSIGITQALDRLPPGPQRDAAISQLSGIPKSERGAIDMRVFEKGFEDIKELANGLTLRAIGGDGELKIVAVDQNGNEKGHLTLTPDSWANPTPESNARATWVDSSTPGTATEMYRFAAELGNDILPSKTQTVEGREMWKRFNDKGFAEQGVIRRRSERGVIDFNALPEAIKKLATLTKDSPEVQTALKRSAINKVLGSLEGYKADITTPEEVIARAPQAKDLTATQKFNTIWRPGLRVNTINSGNPLLKFANHVVHKAWLEAENMARVHLTDDKTGIGPKWRKLSNQEKVEVHELLKAGDRHQRRYTREELLSSNFSPKQVEFIEKFYAVDDVKYQTWNDKRMSNGMDPVKYREGHFPGNFKGDYRSLVFDEKDNIIGYIGTDTLWGHKRAIKAVEQKFPGAKISRMNRKSLGGWGNKSDLFTGMSDLIDVLAKDDPRIAEIKDAVQRAIVERSDATFNANLHAKDKKGIWGNEGNKPWANSPVGEANEAMKAFFEYWEEGMISHSMIPVEAQLTAVLKNEALDNMPRAKTYVTDYVKEMTGRNVSEFGSALNTLIDAPFKLLGLGPSIPRQTVNQFTKRMGQLTQGFWNIPYTVMQFTQYAQTGSPLFTKVAQEYGANPASAIGKAGADAIALLQERLMDKVSNDPTQRVMFDYAENHGMLQFSEFEEVSHVAQSDISRSFDKVVDFNRTLGEKGTRPLTFFTFMRLLENVDMPVQQKLDMAYNLTQDAMVDYSARERAPMFKRMGVLGQTAGNLQQFSLTYLDQMGRWMKDAGKGNPAPLLAGMVVLLSMAGLQGLPFYNTADELVEWITDKFFDEKKNIRRIVMDNPYEWLKSDILQYGPLSVGTGLNMTGRLGMADAAPESFADALSPYASTVGRMATTVYDAVKNPDDVSFAQAARQWAPSSMRGLIENKYLTDQTGTTINKDGQLDYPRTEYDRKARAWAMTSLEEAKAKDILFSNQKSLKADTERVTAIGDKITRSARLSDNYTKDAFEKDLAEYTQRGGDPKQLVRQIITEYEQAALTNKQRIEGTKLRNIQQLRRWLKINEE